MGEPTTKAEQSGQRILLIVAYDGGPFSGIWRQTNARTISNTLQDAIHEIDPEASTLSLSSRTDAGVHARCQPMSFVTQKEVKTRGWVLALSKRLPAAISIRSAARVPMDFDPRSSPIWKRYRYCVRNSQVEDAFLSPFSWRVGEKLDLDLMRAEAESLVGQHDFRAFRSVDDERKETVRHIHSLTVSEDRSRERVLNIEVQGNRFMYNMVRIIAGTLVDVGRGRRKPGAGRRAIETGERRELGMTAPPQGLTLEHVELRQWGEDVWPSEPY